MFGLWTTPSASTPEEAPDAANPGPSTTPTLAEARAAAAPLRAVTRAVSGRASSSSDGLLAVPNPQGRIRAISRSRSPSPTPTPLPSPLPVEDSVFNIPAVDAASAVPPPLVDMDDEYIQRITAAAVKMALEQDREERDRQSRLATEAAVAAALANQTSQVQALRKPDLPPFDKDNIETWIKRIENAYVRSNVTDSKHKFAYLERLFHAKDDSRINRYMWGTQTPEEWTAFLAYLRDRYGRTRKQEVQSLLSGVARDGRRPSDYAAHILELSENATIDDVRKEVFLQQIPKELTLHIASRIKDMTLQQTADVCDEFFDQNGKLINATDKTGVNHIASNLKQPQSQQQQQQQQHQSRAISSSFTTPFEADDSDLEVNAVRFRAGQPQTFKVSNRSSSRGRSGASSNNNSNNNNNNYNNNRSTSSNRFGGASSSSSSSSSSKPQKKVCRFHTNWGEQAENCEGSWCILKHKIAPKGQASR